MHRTILLLLATLALAIAIPASGQAPPDLESALEAMRGYEFGQSRATLRQAEVLVMAASADERRRHEAADALAAFLDGAASNDAKAFACRLTILVGGDATVPALERLIEHDVLGGTAIAALARIPGEAAGAALRGGLAEATAPHRIARINAIAQRRDVTAVETLTALAHDPATGDAAIQALGAVGSPESARALLELRPDARVAAALVVCADRLRGADPRGVIPLYRRALAMAPEARNGAIRGLCAAGDQSVWRMHVGPMLESEDAFERGFAMALVRTTSGAGGTRAAAALLDPLKGAARAALITSLGERGDRAALALIHREARGSDPISRAAAVEALGLLGDGSVVGTLAAAVEAEAALESLGRLQGPGVDEAIARRLRTGTARKRIRLIDALVLRGASVQAGALIPAVRDGRPEVSEAALAALVVLAQPSEIEPLVSLLLGVRAVNRAAAAEALVAAARRDADVDGRVEPIITALHADRTLEERAILLEVLGALGGPHALSAVRAYLDDATLRLAAVAALAAWPDDAPTADLRDIAVQGDATTAAIAFDGFLRMAGMFSLRSASASVQMHEEAMKLAKTAAQRHGVLDALAGISTVEALVVAERSLKDATLRDAAISAVLHIAASLGAEQRERALLAVHRVRALASEPAFMRRAAEVVDSIERDEDFVNDWLIAGPFTADGTPAEQLLKTPFAPETGGTVEWTALDAAHVRLPGRIDVKAALGGDNRVAYAMTSIWSDTAQPARFDLGSDDGIKVWLNGDLLHEHQVMRGLTPGEDRVTGELRFGWNTLLIKISQGGGDWGFACRLRGPDGLGLDGVDAVAGAAPHDPPPGATILFGGSSTDAWMHRDGGPVQWQHEGDALIVRRGTGTIQTRDRFEDMILHVEFMCPKHADSVEGQGRGNSGVYIQGRYEVQILDSFGLEPMPNGCGAIYNMHAPRVNASRPPEEWQSYLIDFKAPRWSPDDEKLAPATITVVHNGVVIHDGVTVPGRTGAGAKEAPTPGTLLLQDHGNPVRFRNIWAKVAPVTWEGPDAPGFEPIFDGATLDGWTQRGGKALYSAENGAIVGRTARNQPNSFLCTDELYGDFVLELEFKVDDELNSGVQIRSESKPDYRNGRVHGYQVEIDPSARAWSAGIYDEARRGWLAPLETNEAARAAFRNEAWNRLRVVARGDRMQTFLNGVPAADLTDDMTARGFIGLQVHGVGGREDALEVRWRDVRVKKLD